MCKKPSSVSHCPTESEIISLDAGLRMDGLLALDLWDMVVEVLRSTNNTVQASHNETRARCNSKVKTQKWQKKAKSWLCQMWIMYPPTHILLKASLSCAFLKTTKLWSRWSSKDEVQPWDTCQEPTELRLIGCSTESIWNPRSKSKTNQPTFLPKEVFSRDQWNHLLPVFNILSFSMFSCSHICDFLSNDQVGKQNAMSKRGQEATSHEGSPRQKRSQQFRRRRDHSHLVARNPRSDKKSSQNLRYLVNPVNADARKEVEKASGSSWRSASRSEVGYSQVSREENAPMASGNSWREEQLQKQRDERASSNSKSTRKFVEGESSRPEFGT